MVELVCWIMVVEFPCERLMRDCVLFKGFVSQTKFFSGSDLFLFAWVTKLLMRLALYAAGADWSCRDEMG